MAAALLLCCNVIFNQLAEVLLQLKVFLKLLLMLCLDLFEVILNALGIFFQLLKFQVLLLLGFRGLGVLGRLCAFDFQLIHFHL